MNKMIVANLVHRPIRSIISIVAVAIEVTLILLIVGLSLGMLHDSTARQVGVGGDVAVRPPNSSLFSFSGSPMLVKYAGLLLKQPHVVAATPVITQMISSGTLELIWGIDIPSFESVGGPMHFLQGGPFQDPYDIIVDDFYAAGHKVGIGSKINLFNHEFRVSGIVANGRGGRRFLPLKTMQFLTGSEEKASMFYVKADNPANADMVVEEIKTIPGMESYNTMTTREYMSMLAPDKIPALSTFLTIVISISVIIGFIVIFQSMYTAVMERTREIGILKSLGASKAYIVRVIVRETLALAIAGIIVGIGFTLAARAGLHARIPTLPIEFSLAWALRATAIAIGGAVLGSIYPAFKAAQKDPIDALAYE
ncbi:MAG TPA: FtsX-like permease family protein [Candidatus Angelobacter sp.]|nr:FtsX-like permease family protein [Candidatus Angelobacter sp.]